MASKKKTKPVRMRVDVSADKATFESRIDRGNVAAVTAPKSEIYVKQPDLQQAHSNFIAATKNLSSAREGVTQADAAGLVARDVLARCVVDYDGTHDVYTACVEKYSVTPEDVSSLGMSNLARSKHTLSVPTDIDINFIEKTNAYQVHVIQAPGMNACVIELSPEPATPTSWTRLPGKGAKRILKGYAPGNYKLRAASLSATEQSEWREISLTIE